MVQTIEMRSAGLVFEDISWLAFFLWGEEDQVARGMWIKLHEWDYYEEVYTLNKRAWTGQLERCVRVYKLNNLEK